MAPTLLFHPLVISTFHQFLFIFIAGFTSARSILRPLGFIVYLLTTWFSLSMFDDYVQAPGWVARTVASAFPQISLTFFERMIVRKITFEVHGNNVASGEAPKGTTTNGNAKGAGSAAKLGPGKISGFRSRYAFGQQVASSMRGLGTPWEIKHIHHFDSRDPTFLPSRGMFIVRNLLKVVACYFGHRFCITTQLNLDHSLMLPEHVPFLRRIGELSATEVGLRYIATVTTVLSIYCFIQGGYSLGAAASVMLNSKAIKDWRPIFGDLSDAYCLRNFWATFWHQGLQNNLRGTAAWATSNIFRLKSYSLASRYMKILIAFFLSGLIHVPSDMGSAVSASESGAIQFFSTQLIGLMIEDLLGPLFKPLWRTRAGRIIARPLGYFWVITFLAWSGPVRWFPVIRMQNAETELIGLGAFKPLMKAFS
ncbi:related to TRI7 - trichothecene biosynthesis gene cluster [Cephalotrichum gorgonifer]|uniref:Related to TRI7 - trichothecene biosynthesis gene cluster n=1 Tax=Cephalotrichum gorgonifer TaxID=2041049 RepID=A0AAE8MWP7_9PEZI|nr:related to TRI7 - trichothecene biosynthesis gene cluster [Cephalotrichum gorgonifer]